MQSMTADVGHPRIIQGGMGIGVSSWELARAVSRLGHLGVVSGTAVDTVLIRRALRAIKPDVVHAWGTEQGAALVANRLGYPRVATPCCTTR